METTIDDMSPELFPELMEQVLAAGALDAYFTPIQMKKSRPAIHFTAICAAAGLPAVAAAIFRHSSTLGLRYHRQQRLMAERSFFPVETPYGAIQVKRGVYRCPETGQESVNLAPEYEACKEAARRSGAPLKEVYAAALAACRQCST